jgi:threonine synthase
MLYNAIRSNHETGEGYFLLICIPISFAGQLILKDICESQITAISVSDYDIFESGQQLAEKEGIFSCPEGATTCAGLCKLLKQGIIHHDETIIIFNTDSGLKYISS